MDLEQKGGVATRNFFCFFSPSIHQTYAQTLTRPTFLRVGFDAIPGTHRLQYLLQLTNGVTLKEFGVELLTNMHKFACCAKLAPTFLVQFAKTLYADPAGHVVHVVLLPVACGEKSPT